MKSKVDPFRYVIVEHIGVLSEDKRGFRKEVNIVSFNGKPPVVDIRTWTPEGKMSKGITLPKEAFENLVKLIKNKDIKLGE